MVNYVRVCLMQARLRDSVDSARALGPSVFLYLFYKV